MQSLNTDSIICDGTSHISSPRLAFFARSSLLTVFTQTFHDELLYLIFGFIPTFKKFNKLTKTLDFLKYVYYLLY